MKAAVTGNVFMKETIPAHARSIQIVMAVKISKITINK